MYPIKISSLMETEQTGGKNLQNV